MLPTADTIVAELKAWCAVERGRPSRVAEIVGVNRSAVSRWLRDQRKPSLNQGLAIQEFLKHERRKFKKRGWRVIALVDTRTARLDEGVIGVVISTHERTASALAANLEFQRSLGTRGHVTTKILTLSRRLHEGETVRSEDVWQNP